MRGLRAGLELSADPSLVVERGLHSHGGRDSGAGRQVAERSPSSSTGSSRSYQSCSDYYAVPRAGSRRYANGPCTGSFVAVASGMERTWRGPRGRTLPRGLAGTMPQSEPDTAAPATDRCRTGPYGIAVLARSLAVAVLVNEDLAIGVTLSDDEDLADPPPIGRLDR